MKPIVIALQIIVFAGVLMASYYLGPPVYWELMSRVTVSGAPNTQIDISGQTDIPLELRLNDQNLNSSTDKLERNEMLRNTSENIEPPLTFSNYEVLRRNIWEQPPPGSEMPPPSAFTLTREMVDFRATGNLIIVTFANHAFLDFVLNWVKHLTALNISNVIVGAMDTEILEALFWQGIPVFDMGSKVNTFDVGWGTPTFHKMGREKVILVDKFLSMGYELLMCDTDMVWLKNPLPYFARFPAADVLVSSDEVVNTVDDDGLEFWERAQGAYNIGIFYWRPTDVARKFALEWKHQLLEDEKIWDQNGFNDLMRRKRLPIEGDKSGLFYAYDGTLKLGILPVSIFCSGHTYFVQDLHEQLGLMPYAVHTTFQFSGTDGKRHRLREAKLFYDRPDYYSPPGGLLSFQSFVPDDLLTKGNHSIKTHFNLINYQIKQIRNALAIATILNRTLVMPVMWCRFDRMWFGHPGILPGTKTKQPFQCPLDHVFEINNMLKAYVESEYGPIINFREYSFMENPRLPKEIRSSMLKVKLCSKKADCDAEVKPLLKLPQNSTDDQIEKAFSQYRDVKIIKFSSMANAFGGFTSKEREDKFRRRVKMYTGIWCCLENSQRGHIYYDFYWDEKPNWEPLPPRNSEEDHPPW